MAENKVKNESLFDGNIWQPTTAQGKELFNLLVDLENEMKKVLKVSTDLASSKPLDSYKNLKEVEENLKKVAETSERLQVVEKEKLELAKLMEKTRQEELKLQREKIKGENAEARATRKTNKQVDEQTKLREKLEKAKSDEAKETAKLREQVNRANREARESAKATLDQENAFKVLSRRTNKAQADYKRLAAEFGITSNEALEALDAFRELDDELRAIDKTARDGRRNVGRYAESLDQIQIGSFNAGQAVDGLIDTFKAFIKNPIILTITAIAAALGLLFKAFQRSEKGSELMRKGAALLEAGMSLLVDIVNSALEAIIAFTEDPVQGFKDLGQALLDNVVNRFQGLLDLLKLIGIGFQQLIDRDFEGLAETAKKAGVALFQTATGIEEVDEKISDIADKINDTANQFLALEKAQRAVRIENRKLSIEVAKAQQAIELFTAAADDDGRSLEEQRKAIQDAAAAREEAAEKQLQIAQNNFNILNREVQLRRKNGEEIQDLLDRRAEAEIALLDTQRELAVQRFENGARERMILLDIFDQELDDLVDFADNLATIRQQIAADETVTNTQRRDALEDANKDLETSLANQVALFEKTQNDLLISRGEVADFVLPIDELLGIEDATELNERIKQLGLVERQRIRLLQVLRDRRTVVNDLRVAEAELNRAELEQANIAADLLFQREALNELKKEGADLDKIEAELEQKRFDQEVKNLNDRIAFIRQERDAQIKAIDERLKAEDVTKEEREQLEFDRLALLEDVSEEELKLQQELNNKLLEEQKRANEKKKAEDVKAAEERIKVQEALFDAFNEAFKRENQARLAAIDQDIAANQSAINNLNESIKNGSEESLRALTFEQRRRGELQAEREEQIKRQQRQEFTLAALQVFASKVASGKDSATALAETLTDTALLKQALAALPSFEEGTDKTGKGNVDKRGGSLAIIHPNEMIFSKKNLEQMANRPETRGEVIDMYNLGAAVLNQKPVELPAEGNINFKRMEERLFSIEEAINKKPVYMGSDIDLIRKTITALMKSKGKTEKITRKMN